MTTEATFAQDSQSKPITLLRTLGITAIAAIAASLASLALYWLVGLVFPEVSAWPGAGPAQIVGATSAYLSLGALVLFLLGRFSEQPRRRFRQLAALGLILSMALPVGAAFGYGAPGAPPASLPTAITLAMMHMVAFAISMPLFLGISSD